MRTKKILALAMATMMTLSSTVIAFADDKTTESEAAGTITGEGTSEGYVEKSIFTVSVPTVSTVPFRIDPQELLLATKDKTNGLTAFTIDGSDAAAGYGDKTLFGTIEETTGTFTSKSANIDFINKSSFEVDVEIKASVTGLTDDSTYDVALLDKDTAFGTATEMKLTLTPTAGTSTAGKVTPGQTAGEATYIAETGATSTVKVAAAPETAFEVAKDTDGNYNYALIGNTDAIAFNSVTFNLAGTVNKAADWKAFDEADTAMNVSLAYSVKKHVDNEEAAFSTGDAVGTINYSKGKGTGELVEIKSIMFDNNGKTYDGFKANGSLWGAATTTDSLITIDAKFMAYFKDITEVTGKVTYTVKGDGATPVEKTQDVTVKVTTE